MSIATKIKTITVKAGQTIADIAIQEYGTVEGMVLIVQANPGLNITSALVAGSELVIFNDVTVSLVKEVVKIEPYASQLQNLLMQWATLVPGIGGGVTVDKIEIPKLQLEFGSDINTETLLRNNDQVFAWWQTENKKFLEYNPQIWSFKYGKSKQVSHYAIDEEELCGDTGFDLGNGVWWTTDSPNSIGDGVLHINTAENETLVAWGNISFTPYGWYQVTYEIKNYTCGRIAVVIGNSWGKEHYAPGVYTQNIVCRNSNTIEFHKKETVASVFDIDNVSIKRITQRQFSIRRKWLHETHLNGINFPVGSSYYRGSIVCPCVSITNTGRKTEFEHSATNSNEKMVVGIDPWDYFYLFAEGHLNERITDYETQQAYGESMRLSSNWGRAKKSLPLRLAIVIDNPEYTVGSGLNPKLIGPFSDIFQMHVKQHFGFLVKFGRESLKVKLFGGSRF